MLTYHTTWSPELTIQCLNVSSSTCVLIKFVTYQVFTLKVWTMQVLALKVRASLEKVNASAKTETCDRLNDHASSTCSNDAALQVHSLSMSITVVYIHMPILHTNLKSTASHAALMFCSTLRTNQRMPIRGCMECSWTVHQLRHMYVCAWWLANEFIGNSLVQMDPYVRAHDRRPQCLHDVFSLPGCTQQA